LCALYKICYNRNELETALVSFLTLSKISMVKQRKTSKK